MGTTIEVPDTLGGTTLSRFGRLMGWGHGDQQARDRIPTLSRAHLIEIGVTAEMARSWRDFYVAVVRENPSNPSAAGRVDLMEAALALLDQRETTTLTGTRLTGES